MRATAAFLFSMALTFLLETPLAWGQNYIPCQSPQLSCQSVAMLLADREGYGRNATGGLGGKFVVVTSDADSGPGSLRYIVEQASEAIWVVFASDMTIDLRNQISVPSNVTIDGRGHSVILHDWGLTVVKSANVIITHIAVDGRYRAQSQAINVVSAHDVWLDHLTLGRTLDRLINVKTGSTDVTLSWIRFEDHNRVMLLNSTIDEDLFKYYDRDSLLRVTLHHCYFTNTVQRHPRAQIGTSHIFNNLLENWDLYGMSFSLEHRSLVEGNIFYNTATHPCALKGPEDYCKNIRDAPRYTAEENGSIDKEEYDKTNPKYHYTHDWRAFLKIRDNLYLGEAKVELKDYRPEEVPMPTYCYSYERPDEALADRIRAGAGNLGKPTAAIKRTCPEAR